MANLVDLYRFAEHNEIDIDWISMEQAVSLSVPLPDGTCCIALDPWKLDTSEKEMVCVAHELGHCMYGAFYNRYAALDVRQRHENQADKWAVSRLVSEDELNTAVANGHTEIWDLAEYFGVTEDFMRKVVCWYKYGNLDVKHYC